MKRFSAALILVAALICARPAQALEPITVELLTMPFGTAQYAMDMAMESLFKELDTPVTLLLKQTPGAMFISRYAQENKPRIRAGEMPFTMSVSSAAILPYMGKGLPPYQDYPSDDGRAVFAINAIAMPWVTYNPNLKSPADFVGRKVGIAERSRPNQANLPNEPLFDYAYGGFNKVNWQYLGFANAKDAIINGSIDVTMGNVSGAVKVAEDGTLYMDAGTMDPSLMEVVSAGKPFYVVSEDPEIMKAAYDPEKHLVHVPVLMKAGTMPGQTEDAWVKAAFIIYSTDAYLADEVVEEIVYQVFTNKERLADYYEGFSYLGDSPYPIGMDPEWVHPGLLKAMVRLGMDLPEGVELPE